MVVDTEKQRLEQRLADAKERLQDIKKMTYDDVWVEGWSSNSRDDVEEIIKNTFDNFSTDGMSLANIAYNLERLEVDVYWNDGYFYYMIPTDDDGNDLPVLKTKEVYRTECDFGERLDEVLDEDFIKTVLFVKPATLKFDDEMLARFQVFRNWWKIATATEWTKHTALKYGIDNWTDFNAIIEALDTSSDDIDVDYLFDIHEKSIVDDMNNEQPHLASMFYMWAEQNEKELFDIAYDKMKQHIIKDAIYEGKKQILYSSGEHDDDILDTLKDYHTHNLQTYKDEQQKFIEIEIEHLEKELNALSK